MLLILETLLVLILANFIVKSIYSDFSLSSLKWILIFFIAIVLPPPILKLIVVSMGLILLFVKLTKKDD